MRTSYLVEVSESSQIENSQLAKGQAYACCTNGVKSLRILVNHLSCQVVQHLVNASRPLSTLEGFNLEEVKAITGNDMSSHL